MVNRAAIFVLFFLPMFFFTKPTLAKAFSADDILTKVEKQSSPPNETTEMLMTIIEPDGSKKERSLTIKRSHKKEQKALVKIHSPADLKGVGFLSIQSKSKEDQWLYLPSAKRARRIVGSGSSSRFLDSDLTYEDFRASTYNNFKNKILTSKSNNKVAVIESKAKRGSKSSYGKIHTWVNLKDYRVTKAHYFNKKNKKIKIMVFKKYKKYGKKFWRAKLIEVKDVKNNRKTRLAIKRVSLKKLSDDEFSMSELEEE